MARLSCRPALPAQAQVWLALGRPHAQRARREVEAALPLLLAHGSLEARCTAVVALAEILLAQHTGPAAVAAESSRWVIRREGRGWAGLGGGRWAFLRG